MKNNHEDDDFSFFKIPLSPIFVFALMLPQITHKSAKSYVVMLLKGQLFVLENHSIYKNKLKYQNITVKKLSLKAD